MRNLAAREEQDIQALEKFEDIYRTQKQSISRRLLGAKAPAETRVVAYLTEVEAEAVKGLAESTGMNVSTLVRLTMTTLAASWLPVGQDSQADPRAV